MTDRPPADPFASGLPVLDGVAPGGGAPRVRLRPMRPNDAEALLEVFSDADILRYWTHGPLTTLGDAQTYLAAVGSAFDAGDVLQWAIADAETDRLVGTVMLMRWAREHRRIALGYLIGRPHWGRGLASEAVRAALAFGFGPMGLHRVEADVDPDNAASLALLARLGFREEGRLAERWFTFGAWRDSVVLGLLARETG